MIEFDVPNTKRTDPPKWRQWSWCPRGWFIAITLSWRNFGIGFFCTSPRFNGIDFFLGPLCLTIQPPWPRDMEKSHGECRPERTSEPRAQ